MNCIYNDYRKFALSKGVNGLIVDDFAKKGISDAYVNPTILEERSMNVIGLDIFSRLMYDRILILGTGIDSDVANIINSQLLYLSSLSNDNISLYINSPGGSVTDGLAIYDVMNFITPQIRTCCMGMAASMGAVLLSSGTKGLRHSLPNGDIMIHQPLGGAKGQASDILIEAEQIKKCKNTLYRILSENTGKDIKKIEKDADRDKWFTASEAKEYGLIDQIIVKNDEKNRH